MTRPSSALGAILSAMGLEICEVCSEKKQTHVIVFKMKPEDHRPGCPCPESEKTGDGYVYVCDDCAENARKCMAGTCPDAPDCEGRKDSLSDSAKVLTILEAANEALIPKATEFGTTPDVLRFGILHKLSGPEAVAITKAIEAAGHRIDYSEMRPKIVLQDIPTHERPEGPAREPSHYPSPVVMVPGDGNVH